MKLPYGKNGFAEVLKI